MSLCQACRQFNIQAFRDDPLRSYRATRILQGLVEQCPFCMTISSEFDLPTRDGLEKLWINFELFASEKPTQSTGLRAKGMKISLGRTRTNDTYGKLMLHMAAESGSAAALNDDVIGRYYGNASVASGEFQAIRNWLHQCLRGHLMCVTSLSGINQFNPEQCVLPTRCVEVIGDRVRLRETAGLVGSYIILSHRWDDDTKLCRTTMENYETRKDEIPLQWLSLTFQDAIAVTKRLGIRYIWIDSICIIQEGDGGRDWRAEASKMAQYYQQSLLTITGTCSSQYLGLCPSREEKPRLFLRLPYRNRAGVHVGSFYMYESVNLTGSYYENFVMGSELMGRGWIFQERLLSRRLVCFTPKGTFMECQTAMPQNECGELVTGNAPGNRLSFSNPTFCDVFRAGDFQVWYNMVKEYSTLRLTQNTDRPEAILGVASEFREVLHKCFKTEEISYGGGLWEKDLWRGLCWMTAEDPPEGGFQRLGKATWSWTSLLARVDWPSIESAQCACQSHRFVSSSPATSDDTDGQPAYIAMSARLQPVIFAGLFKKKTMYKLLGYDSPPETNPPFFSKSLRVICSPAKPKVVAGWASIEHEEFQTLASLRRPNVEHPLAALHVSTMHRLPGGFHLGYLVPWHSAFVVLFVQHMSDKQYRRVGAGILFGPEIERGFTKGKFQDIELI